MTFALAAATLGMALACFVSFSWGVARHFRKDERMPRAMRATSAISLLGIAWFVVDRIADLVRGEPARPARDAAAMIVMAASAALFWQAVDANRRRPLTIAFSSDVPTFVQRAGPYRFVRHPFYLSYVAFWVAVAVAASGPWHWIMAVAMAGLYTQAARMEEAKFAVSGLSADYERYKTDTGMMLPWPRMRRSTTTAE